MQQGVIGIIPTIKVITMNLKNWIKNTTEVTLWLEKENRGEHAQVIEMSIMLGNQSDSDETRSTYWTAIRSIGSAFADFPKARRGREPSIPEEADTNAISVKNAIRAAFAGISNPDIDALADHYAKQAYNALVKAYKENRWDGTMNGEVPTMTPPAVKAKEGGDEEE